MCICTWTALAAVKGPPCGHAYQVAALRPAGIRLLPTASGFEAPPRPLQQRQRQAAQRKPHPRYQLKQKLTTEISKLGSLNCDQIVP
jgi:hypothetical protein